MVILRLILFGRKDAPHFDVDKVLAELHGGLVGGHFRGEMSTHKVLRVGYYWPTLFKDAHSYARKCQVLQVNIGRERKHAFPLYIVTVENPLEQWGLDVVSEINPNSLKLYNYILTTTYYFTRWLEEIPLKNVNDNEVIQFLQ